MAFLSSMNVVGSGLTAQQLRLDVVSENITNRTTTRTEGGGAYRRKMVVFEAEGERSPFQAAVENVKETERVKNDAEYRLATGQMDNPAEMSIASSQWSMSVNLLIQLRNKALDAYNELMRISL